MSKKVSRQFSPKNSCPICGKNDISKFWAMRGYRLFHCLNCDMIWDPFPPASAESIYNETYFVNENPKGGYANYFYGMNINKRTFRERIKRINKKVGTTGKMLDIGSALGDSLLEAEKLGWKNLFGVELSKYAASESRKRGLNVNNGTLESARYKSNYFDIVTLQDVIEHLENPKSVLKEVYRILRPGGCVYIVTPDIGGLWQKFLGSLWYHYKPGEHLMYFSQKTLAQILGNTGFNNIETKKTYHVMSLEYIFNRLRYYSPWLFEFLLKLTKNNFLGRLSFRVYAGEIEGWGGK